jgi:hypothetical protein
MSLPTRPLWTRMGFAIGVALALLALAVVALKKAARFAQLNVLPPERSQADNAVAVMLLILSMLLVVGAIVVPLVIRRQADKRLTPPAGRPH